MSLEAGTQNSKTASIYLWCSLIPAHSLRGEHSVVSDSLP